MATRYVKFSVKGLTRTNEKREIKAYRGVILKDTVTRTIYKGRVYEYVKYNGIYHRVFNRDSIYRV